MKNKTSTCELCGKEYETYPIILDNNPFSITAFFVEEMLESGEMRNICEECRSKEGNGKFRKRNG